MYFFFMHFQGGRLYMHNHKGQVLCVLIWPLNGLTPSALKPILRFLGSFTKSGYSRSNAVHCVPSDGCLSMFTFSGSGFGSSSFSFFLSVCHVMSFASSGSTKYLCRRGVIEKYHTTFLGTFFPLLYRLTPHTGQMVFSASSPGYMMQSFKQTWYLTCGRSRGHKTFLASAILVGNVLSFGRQAFQNVIISS